ncbi:MAG: alpha/beta hydrolase-fold protein [Thermoanaerobaculia bacterium]|nr:alpha/beta hydrolase-fold protein [Thermoanaerobaculia bacterium]
MTLAIRELAARGPLTAAEVDAFLAAHPVPLVEGSSATFLYRGEAHAVRLHHWLHGLPSAPPFARLPGCDLWYLIQELPPRARVEYKLGVVEREGEEERLIRDPRNPLLAHDPFGANSVCHGSLYERPDWTLSDPEARPGTLERLALPSAALGREVAVDLYLPARFQESGRYPLLVVHDGEDYLRYSALRTVLDNLIHRLEVAPLVVALPAPGERLVEYADHPGHARFLAEELVPALERRLPLRREPAARGLMGASFGAVASLSTAVRYPGRFGRLLLQSGSFAFTDIGPGRRGPVFDPVVRFVNRFRDRPERVSERVFATCGVYESLIYENRSLVPLLRATGMEVRYEEAWDGHNWENWRDRLRAALSWLFPGPLRMVHE